MGAPLPEGRQIGQVYKAASPLEALAAALTRGVGAYKQRGIDAEAAKLAGIEQAGMAAQQRQARADADREFKLKQDELAYRQQWTPQGPAASKLATAEQIRQSIEPAPPELLDELGRYGVRGWPGITRGQASELLTHAAKGRSAPGSTVATDDGLVVVRPGTATAVPVRTAGGAIVKPKSTGPTADASADDLRKEFQNQQVYKDSQIVAASFEKIKSASPTAAGDMGLVFGIMKIFDPNSVVRETEYANAQNAAGVPEKIRNAYNKVLAGEFLTPEQRASFRAEAEKVYQAQRQRYEATAGEYRRLAKQRGLNSADVVLDVFGQPTAAPGAAAARKSVNGKTYEKRADGWYEVP
jgi:hypothetical protein